MKMGAIFLARRRLHAESIRPYGITLKQLFLLQGAKDKGSITPSQAAELLYCDRPTATVVINNCVRRGLLERSPTPGDRRSVTLTPAPGGLELLALIAADRPLSTCQLDPLDVLDTEELRVFESTLSRIHSRAKVLFN